MPAADKGKFYSIEFDGAMSNSTVWINGHELGGRPYGYSSFEFDLTPDLNFGAENVMAVRLMPEDAFVALVSRRGHLPQRLAGGHRDRPRGPLGDLRHHARVSRTASATVSVKSEIRNRNAAGRRRSPSKLRSWTPPASRSGASPSDVTVPARVRPRSSPASRWPARSAGISTDPYLYQAVTKVRSDDVALDRYVTPFGIRTIEFNRDKGFLLNGRVMKLHGVCDHHDLGALGTAVNRRATERQLQIMQRHGRQRHSHQPQPALARAARILRPPGLLVMDEAFDMWRSPKVRNGYAQVLRPMERARHARHDAAATATIPA